MVSGDPILNPNNWVSSSEQTALFVPLIETAEQISHHESVVIVKLILHQYVGKDYSGVALHDVHRVYWTLWCGVVNVLHMAKEYLIWHMHPVAQLAEEQE